MSDKRPGHRGTGKSREPAGWKACPTSGGVCRLPSLSVACCRLWMADVNSIDQPFYMNYYPAQLRPMRHIMKSRFVMLIVLICLLRWPRRCFAHKGAIKGISWASNRVDPIPADKIPPPTCLVAGRVLEIFKIQPSSRIELAASEPLVQDPVAMALAPDGRIWVAEMGSFMPMSTASARISSLGR